MPRSRPRRTRIRLLAAERAELERRVAARTRAFITPVRVGTRIRAHARLLSVDEIEPNVFQQVNEITVEIESESKPAMVAESITRLYL